MYIAAQALQGFLMATGLAITPAVSDETPSPDWTITLEAPASAPQLMAEATLPTSIPAGGDPQVETLNSDELSSFAGGTGVSVDVITDQTLNAINHGNSITGVNVGSGGINITAGAFNGFDGVGNFVLNTGHNNNLQSSMNVSVVLGQ